MTTILFTGGLGDVWALESMMNEAERAAIKTIYFACRNSRVQAALWNASKTYRKVKTIVLPTTGTYYELAGVRKDFDLPPDIQDWSISLRFREFLERKFTLSTFLTDPPAKLPFDLPDDFITLQHETTDNDPQQRALRDLDSKEWTKIIARLEANNLPAVVLNSPSASPPPDHPLIVNLVGKTTMSQSVAILRRSIAFWGVASGMATLACQQFPSTQLWIKAPERWHALNKHIYCAPHTSFPFLYRHLVDSRPNTLNKQMKTITLKFNCTRLVQGGLVMPGSLMEMTPDDARPWLLTKQAEVFERPEPPVLRTADKPAHKRAVRIK